MLTHEQEVLTVQTKTSVKRRHVRTLICTVIAHVLDEMLHTCRSCTSCTPSTAFNLVSNSCQSIYSTAYQGFMLCWNLGQILELTEGGGRLIVSHDMQDQ